MQEILPHYSHTVMVPVARLETAPHMLELAVSLADPDNGRVIALMVSVGEQEAVSESIEDLEKIIEPFNERRPEDRPIEIVTQVAPSVTRGILDATRDYGSETLILGVQQSDRRQVKLGAIVENVMEAAPCDVLVYRMSESPTYDRVVVPIDGGEYNQIALNAGVMLAKSHDISLSPRYIQRDYTYQADRDAQIRKALTELPPEKVNKDIVPGRQPAERILMDLDSDDLLVLGFSQKIDPDLQIGENLSGILLNRSQGPVLLASRFSNRRRNSFMGTLERQAQRFNPALTQVERNELVWQARHAALLNIDYSMLILFSVGIASLGLLLNSAAVIIGAMLVAPLMSPLAALATGITIGENSIIRRAALTLLQGVLLAIALSFTFGLIVPMESATPEMLARGNPTLLDAAVALVSGMVAAYASARKGIPAALAGVAIAAALMPPVCTIGLGLALGNFDLAGGASLLFVTNIVFIVAAEYLVFVWLGLRPSSQDEVENAGNVSWLALIGAMLLFVVFSLIQLGQQAIDTSQIENQLESDFAQATLINLDVDESADGLHIQYDVRSVQPITPEQVEAAQLTLENLLDRPVQLDVAVLSIVSERSETETVIIDYLNEAWPIDHLHRLIVTPLEDNSLAVDIDLRMSETVTPEQVQQAESDLGEALGQEVRLFVVLAPVISSDTSSANFQEIDPESTQTSE